MRGYTVGWTDVELVLGAIVYDFGRRENAVYPDAELGRQALRAAREGIFPLGRQGAGRSVTVGKTFGLEGGEFSGQGGAFRRLGPTKVGVFTVVNAFGAIVDREGNIVRGHFDAETETRMRLVEGLEKQLPQAAPGNTTLTLVITNQKVTRRELRQLGVQVHGSMARAIQPFHALVDGDVLYTVSTNEVANEELTAMSLGVVASELAWDAVLSCVDESEASSG
jgi:6-aminohexanoate-oligomer endohydrolase